MTFIPMYLRTRGNFLLVKEDYVFVFLLFSYIALQLVTIKIQQKRPRFLIPRSMRYNLFDDYYRYEHDFEEEANLSNNSFLSTDLNMRTDTKSERT